MESSSPLAAMHPAAAHGPHWGCPSPGPFGVGNPFGPGRRHLHGQPQCPRPDMFDAKGTIRGSSPSASLVADMSQNFTLDPEFSPRIATPRRSLFTSRMANRALLSTSPLPVSLSPRDMQDAMDISPVAQKETFRMPIDSPTRPELLDDDMIMDSPLSYPQGASGPLKDGRKRLGLRTRGQRPGPGASGASAEFVEDSPPREQRPQTATSPSGTSIGAVRKPMHFSSMTGTRELRTHASPGSAHARHSPNPFNRTRRQYRRSISMFENSVDVMKGKVEDSLAHTDLQSVMDIGEAQELLLPHFFPDGENDGIPRISCETFLEFLNGKYNECFTQKVVIDCRFEYEYEGGHIDGAVNCNDKDLLARQLFETPMEGRPILIFHCEYSVHRAPRMARHIRSEDRNVNAEFYPHLTYPEIYILAGGYSDFFKVHRDRCYPQAYVEMNAEEHANTCERELGKLQQKRKGLGRAKTFAFGHREPIEFESPTAPGRYTDQTSPMMIGNSPILGNYRSPARRMASY
ncbi:M-phase inducer phosphatase [Xylaria sp. CBS 124048]|nr:M-phase inducer phosphatase [Xylaria sp. CBS 124048]